MYLRGLSLLCFRTPIPKVNRKRVPVAPTAQKPKLDVRFAPVKKRLAEASPSPSSSDTPPPSNHNSGGKIGIKSALRTRSTSHDLSVRFSSEENPDRLSGRLRKRNTTVHSYEELSDIDSDDDTGSSRRRRNRSAAQRKDSEVNNNSDLSNAIERGSTASQHMSPDRDIQTAASSSSSLVVSESTADTQDGNDTKSPDSNAGSVGEKDEGGDSSEEYENDT